jgi:hypothetical protein
MKAKMILSTILVIITAAPAFASGGMTCKTGDTNTGKEEYMKIEMMKPQLDEKGLYLANLELLKKQALTSNNLFTK